MPNPVITCLLNHRSIRKFQDRPLEHETLELIIKAGVRAATAGNLQHYSLIVVDDPMKMKVLLGEQETEHSTAIFAVVDTYRLKRWFELNRAPFYFDQFENLLISFWDAIIALHNIVIAAESLGLGAFYIGNVLSMDLAGVLGTPEYVFPAGLALFGYPDEQPELAPRLPMEAVVHHNSYQIPSDEQVGEYYRFKNQRWDEISDEQRQKLLSQGITNWAQRVTLGHYTADFIESESQAIMENLHKAKFRLPSDPTYHAPREAG